MENRLGEIRIMGMRVRIVVDDRIVPERHADGEYNHGQCKISLAPGMVADQQGEILLHEIIEAIAARLEIDMLHAQLTAMVAGLYAVVRDNPAIMQRIIKGKPFTEGSRQRPRIPQAVNHT